MSNCFEPSLQEGLDLDLAVRQAFLESMSWCQTNLENYSLGVIKKSDSIHDRPSLIRASQFGFYYSLSTNLNMWNSSSIKENAQDLIVTWHGANGEYSQYWQGENFYDSSTHHGIAVTKLSSPYYSYQEIQCLVKWLDMEPNNSICLSSLEDFEFKVAGKNLLMALDFMKKILPEFYEEFTATTREIILAKPSGCQKITFGGVSSFALWGALCLNIEAHQDWWKYVPSLIHEYSHNVLFAKAMSCPVVNNNPEDLYFSPLRGAMRPMDGIFHAAFVSAREVFTSRIALAQTTIKNYDKNVVNYLKEIEITSRKSFDDCFKVIESKAELTELGSKILQNTVMAMKADQSNFKDNLKFISS